MKRAGIGVAYRRRQTDGPTVLLVHGIPGAGRAWSRVEGELDTTLDVVTPDLVGFGDSYRPERPTIETIGPEAQANALASLLDELGVGRATVVGHDFGAPVAVLLAASRPELVGSL